MIGDKSRGAIALIIVVVVLLVAALGFVGWRMLIRSDAKGQSREATETSAQVILTQEDLDAATKSLDEIDFSNDDAKAAELQAEL